MMGNIILLIVVISVVLIITLVFLYLFIAGSDESRKGINLDDEKNDHKDSESIT